MSLITGLFGRDLIQPGSVDNGVIDAAGVDVLVGTDSGLFQSSSSTFVTVSSLNLPVPGPGDPNYFYCLFTQTYNEGFIIAGSTTTSFPDFLVQIALGSNANYLSDTVIDETTASNGPRIGSQLIGFWETSSKPGGTRPLLLRARRVISGPDVPVNITILNTRICAVRLK